MKRKNWLVFGGGIVMLLFLVSCVQEIPSQGSTTTISSTTTVRENDGKTTEMTPELCTSAGGNWNECGSACAGTGADACIQMCVAQCECGGIAGFSCPKGYTCRLSGKYPDEMGACVPS